jgi:hypothetical protein
VCVEQAAHNVKLDSAKYAPIITFFIIFPLVKLLFVLLNTLLLDGIKEQLPQPDCPTKVLKLIFKPLSNPCMNLYS